MRSLALFCLPGLLSEVAETCHHATCQKVCCTAASAAATFTWGTQESLDAPQMDVAAADTASRAPDMPPARPGNLESCGARLQEHKAEPDAEEERDADEREQLRLKKLGKDPTARTDFLPDKEREAEEGAVRAQLRKEYELRQKAWPSLLHPDSSTVQRKVSCNCDAL